MMWNIRRNKSQNELRVTTELPSSSLRSCLRKEADNNSKSSKPSLSSNNSARSATRSSSSLHSSETGSRNSNTSFNSFADMSSKKCSLDIEASQSAGSNQSATLPSRTVGFNEVQVREYERIVSDNPCCSSGPPVGIGWKHSEIEVVDIDSFEQRRNGRRVSTEMVLTRHERENLLKHWGSTPEDITQAIRINIKIKNQRRQTVRNLNKAFLEENFEKATRRLKRAFSMKRSTGEELQTLQRQAMLAARALSAVEVPLPTTDFSEENEESALPCETSTITDEGDDDIKSQMSGLTLGNSTTASMKEMEDFYRELELDLFGEEELPYMVGRTIECDTNSSEADYCVPMGSIDSQSAHRGEAGYYDSANWRFGGGRPSPLSPQAHYVDSPSTSTGSCNTESNHLNCQIHPMAIPQLTKVEYYPASSHPSRHPYPYGAQALPSGYFFALHHHPFMQPYPAAHIQTTTSQQSQELPNNPRVCHVPLPIYSSPTGWMEGSDHGMGHRRVHCYEAITISEAVDEADGNQRGRY